MVNSVKMYGESLVAGGILDRVRLTFLGSSAVRRKWEGKKEIVEE